MKTASVLLLAACGLVSSGTSDAVNTECELNDMWQLEEAIEEDYITCAQLVPYLSTRFTIGFPTNAEQAAICAKCPELVAAMAATRWPPCNMWVGMRQYSAVEVYGVLSDCSNASSSDGDASETSAIRIEDGE
jgi:hypothetical protein